MVEIYWFFSPFSSIKSHLFPFLEVEIFSKHWLWKSDAGFIGFEEGSETCVVCVSLSLFFKSGGRRTTTRKKFKFWNFKNLTCEFCCPSGLLVKVSADFSLSEFVFCFFFLAGGACKKLCRISRRAVGDIVALSDLSSGCGEFCFFSIPRRRKGQWRGWFLSFSPPSPCCRLQ